MFKNQLFNHKWLRRGSHNVKGLTMLCSFFAYKMTVVSENSMLKHIRNDDLNTVSLKASDCTMIAHCTLTDHLHLPMRTSISCIVKQDVH
jgi:hypothetical protein